MEPASSGWCQTSGRDEEEHDLVRIDSTILDVTEWLCRRLQVLTGKTNVWLAAQLTNLSIIVYFAWAGVYF